MPSDHDEQDAFWSLVLAMVRGRAHVQGVSIREANHVWHMSMEPYGRRPSMFGPDLAEAEVRIATLDTHVIPAPTAQAQIARTMGFVPMSHPIEMSVPMSVPSSPGPVPVPTPPTPLPVPPTPGPPPDPTPDPEPQNAEVDGASIRYSLMELD